MVTFTLQLLYVHRKNWYQVDRRLVDPRASCGCENHTVSARNLTAVTEFTLFSLVWLTVISLEVISASYIEIS